MFISYLLFAPIKWLIELVFVKSVVVGFIFIFYKELIVIIDYKVPVKISE